MGIDIDGSGTAEDPWVLATPPGNNRMRAI